jgi:hypothetical protein
MSQTILRARTVLTKNGKRINWNNVAYFTYKKDELNFILDIRWKYKAGIMSEEIIMEFKNNAEMYKYFKRYGIVAFSDDIFINLNHIMLIEETPVSGPQEKILIRIIIMDGFQIVRKLLHDNWVWWKTTYV